MNVMKTLSPETREKIARGLIRFLLIHDSFNGDAFAEFEPETVLLEVRSFSESMATVSTGYERASEHL